MVIVTEGRPVSALPSCRKTEVVLYTYDCISTAALEMPTSANRPSNKSSIVPVSCVPVSTIKYSDGLIIFYRKTSKETDESNFIINLAVIR